MHGTNAGTQEEVACDWGEEAVNDVSRKSDVPTGNTKKDRDYWSEKSTEGQRNSGGFFHSTKGGDYGGTNTNTTSEDDDNSADQRSGMQSDTGGGVDANGRDLEQYNSGSFKGGTGARSDAITSGDFTNRSADPSVYGISGPHTMGHEHAGYLLGYYDDRAFHLEHDHYNDGQHAQAHATRGGATQQTQMGLDGSETGGGQIPTERNDTARHAGSSFGDNAGPATGRLAFTAKGEHYEDTGPSAGEFKGDKIAGFDICGRKSDRPHGTFYDTCVCKRVSWENDCKSSNSFPNEQVPVFRLGNHSGTRRGTRGSAYPDCSSEKALVRSRFPGGHQELSQGRFVPHGIMSDAYGGNSILFAPSFSGHTEGLSCGWNVGPNHRPCAGGNSEKIVGGGAPMDHREGGRIFARILNAPWTRFTVAPTQQWEAAQVGRSWPLHIKRVPRMKLDLMYPWILPELRGAYAYASSCLFDEEVLSKLQYIINAEEEADLSEEDVGRLLQEGIIEKCTRDEVKGQVRVFSVLEIGKQRRRLISEPRDINAQLLFPGEIALPGIPEICEVVKQASSTSFACTVDIDWCFGHFELSATKMFYSFRKGDQWFCLKTVPTGQRHCPSLAQSIFKSIAEQISRRCGVSADAYIDNIRFVGEISQLKAALAMLDVFARMLDFKWSPDAMFTQTYTFLGIYFDHAEKTISIGQKTRTKLLQWAREQMDCFTIANCLQLFGLVLFASRVMGIQAARFYYVFKFIKRRCRYNLQLYAFPWRIVKEQLQEWIDHTLTAPPFRLLTPLPAREGPTIFTDACLAGYGIVIFWGDGRIQARGAAWDQVEDICILELRAVLAAAIILPECEQPTQVKLFIDNTTTIAVLNKGRSPSFLLHTIALRILDLFRKKNYEVSIEYVASKQNLADIPSRIDWNMLKLGIFQLVGS